LISTGETPLSSRLDVWLVENGFASSRQKAKTLIESGRVVTTTVDGQTTPLKKSSVAVDDILASKIRVETQEGPEFVSRGGLKLLGALKTTGVSFQNRQILDIGISTGGFTDCALQAGAKQVVGVDVGHGQLAGKLAADPRVTLIEGINAREIAVEGKEALREQILSANGGSKFEIIVIDVSFISLKLILPAAAALIREGGNILALVKPQFEVGREGIGRGGIVKDAKLYPGVETSLRDVCASLGLKVESYFESPILGSDGNREFFIHATVPQLGFF
jgi:23S rRNA (cytidine1920-2'-O)/16S rRNA (cytidine1409-2'-O)-methyltransferase